MNRTRRIGFWLGSFALVYLLVSLFPGIFLAEIAVHPGRRLLTTRDGEVARRMAARSNSVLESVSIIARDGVVLRAWSIIPRIGTGDSVILLHGLGDNRMGMISYAELLLSHGYGVLMPDARAQGESGGALASYGLVEQEDIRHWLIWMGTQHPAGCIFGFGESMGAAQLLQAVSVKPGFCAVAAESPFATFREISYDRMGQFFHTGPWLGRTLLRPTIEFAFLYAKRKYGLDLQQVSPQESAAAATIPILLMHGAVDRNIPLRHSRMIQTRNSRIVLWVVPNADHCGAMGADPEQFSHRLLEWFHDSARSSRSALFARGTLRQSAPSW